MNDTQPIFKPVFGDTWDTLPHVLQHHYANRPYSRDTYLAQGQLKIRFGGVARVLSPLLHWFGALVPHQGNDVPVSVWFRSEPHSNAYRLERTFHFDDRPTYLFYSRLVPVSGDVLIEYVKFGIGWKHRCYFDGQKVVLEHLGYVWRFGHLIIPVPLAWLLGKGYGEETALNDNAFAMKVELTHFLFGKIYEYAGQFEMSHA